MLGLKLKHVSKRGHWCDMNVTWHRVIYVCRVLLYVVCCGCTTIFADVPILFMVAILAGKLYKIDWRSDAWHLGILFSVPKTKMISASATTFRYQTISKTSGILSIGHPLENKYKYCTAWSAIDIQRNRKIRRDTIYIVFWVVNARYSDRLIH